MGSQEFVIFRGKKERFSGLSICIGYLKSVSGWGAGFGLGFMPGVSLWGIWAGALDKVSR
jgi:hypothetical protein